MAGGSYGYNSGGSSGGSNQSSFSNSDSGSKSSSRSASSGWSHSSADSSSESGAKWTPWQQAIVERMQPELWKDYQASRTVNPWSQYISEMRGAPATYTPVAAFPEVTVGGIWTPEQIQGRVNETRSQNDMAVAGQARRIGERAAASGYGANSPLAQELRAGLYGQNLAANTQAENQLRWNAAQGNAEHLLSTQREALGRARDLSAANLARDTSIDRSEQEAINRIAQMRSQDLQLKGNQTSALLAALTRFTEPQPFSRSTSTQRSGSAYASSSVSDSSSSSRQRSGSSGSSNNNSFNFGEQWSW